MAYCKLYQDYDKRTVFNKGNVVHAAREVVTPIRRMRNSEGSFDVIEPKKKTSLVTACGRSEFTWDHKTHNERATGMVKAPSRAGITCKHCQAALGMKDSFVDENRYVLVEKESGYFYNNGQWKQSIFNARLYKHKHAAKAYGTTRILIDDDGKPVPKEQVERMTWWKKDQHKHKKEFNTDKYEIKRVRIELID